jgi:hypothetical protein
MRGRAKKNFTIFCRFLNPVAAFLEDPRLDSRGTPPAFSGGVDGVEEWFKSQPVQHVNQLAQSAIIAAVKVEGDAFQVVKRPDAVAVAQESFANVRADEARAAGDEKIHGQTLATAAGSVECLEIRRERVGREIVLTIVRTVLRNKEKVLNPLKLNRASDKFINSSAQVIF